MALRVAVTGPTGEIGISTIEALEVHPEVTQIVGMARRPFDPAHDDVASAIALAVTTTTAPPGAYNIADDGLLTFSDVGRALGARPIRVPHVAAVVTSEVLARLPFVPSALEWLHAGRASTVMDTSKVKNQLGWQPEHTAAETLAALARTVA